MRSLRCLILAALLGLVGGLAACSDDGGGAVDVRFEGRDADDRDGDGDGDGEDEPTGDGDGEDEPTDDPGDDEPTDEGDPDDDGGELPAAAGPYVEALVDTFLSGEDDELFATDEAQARCIATRVVGIVQVERLEAAGITPEQFAGDDFDFTPMGLPAEDGVAIFDAFGGCGLDFLDLMIEGLVTGSADPEAMRACLEAALDREAMRQAMGRAFVDSAFEDSPEFDAVFSPLLACAFGQLGSGG